VWKLVRTGMWNLLSGDAVSMEFKLGFTTVLSSVFGVSETAGGEREWLMLLVL
jgi:hypothetical protein